MPSKKTDEEYKTELEQNYPEFESLESYKGNKVKILHRHKICGYEWMVKPNVLMTNTYGCPFCSGKVRKDTNYFKKEVSELVGDEYEVLTEYKNTHSKIRFIHKCGNEFKMTAHNFLAGQRCPVCQHRSYVKDTTEFKSEVYDLVVDEYSVIGEYSNVKTKIEMVHNACRNSYYVTPNDFLQGYRCPHCYGNIKKTQEIFEKNVREIHGDEYTVIGKYVNYSTKVQVKHNICGHEWNVTPRDFLYSKSGCPKCNQSKGEKEIERVLTSMNVKFESQKRFKDLRGLKNMPLSYDFFIEEKNVLIEYQGQQHYYPVARFGGYDSFASQVIRDNLKREYAKVHNIQLLKIPYTKYRNIREILEEQIA